MRGCLDIKPGGTAEVKAFVPVNYRDESLFLIPKYPLKLRYCINVAGLVYIVATYSVIVADFMRERIFSSINEKKVIKHDYTKL
jgi:hypothetical protein